MEQNYCAIIGAPPMSFPWGYDEEDERCDLLKRNLLRTITDLQKQGIDGFVVPMDSGVGLYAAELVNQLREQRSSPDLICVIPYEEQAAKWTPELRERYYSALEKCGSTILVGLHRDPLSTFKAMMRALECTDMVLIVVGSEREPDPLIGVIEYLAARDGYETVTLCADDLQG